MHQLGALLPHPFLGRDASPVDRVDVLFADRGTFHLTGGNKQGYKNT